VNPEGDKSPQGERLLALAEQLAGVGYWHFDIGTRKITWSDEVFRIHGLPRTEVEPDYAQLLELYHPQDREILGHLVSRALLTGEGYEFEARVIRPGGEARHVMAKAECARDNAGRVSALYGVFQDVTARNKEERFIRALTDHVPAMVGYWDRDLRCKYANFQYREWFGRAPHQIIGISMQELMGEELFRKNEPHARAAMAGQPQRFERELTRTSGEKGYTLAQYIPDVDQHGEVLGMYVLVTDVTQLKETELRLQQTNDALRRALERARAADS
jgi:PAS domain S-box-containing protein